jgi:hypothetical protein
VKVYVINLDRDTDRWNSAQNELSRLGIHGDRCSAIDKDRMSDGEQTFVTNGVLACWQSHRKVFQQFLNSGEEFALVLEDDFQVRDVKKFKRLLAMVEQTHLDVLQIGFITPGIHRKIDHIFKNIEAVMFWCLSRALRLILSSNSPSLNRLRIRSALQIPFGFVQDDFLPGTHTYLISRRAAEMALGMNSPQFLSADDFFTAWAKMRSIAFVRPLRTTSTQKNFQKFSGPRFINS